jgi:hypothetical protein
MATAIARVLTTKRSFRQSFGAEYIIPIATKPSEIIAPVISFPIKHDDTPKIFVRKTKIHACPFVTIPVGIGLPFPFVRSKSESIRSFKTYIPTMIMKEPRGSEIIIVAKPNKYPEFSSAPKIMPGMQRIPAKVAKEYIRPHLFL